MNRGCYCRIRTSNLRMDAVSLAEIDSLPVMTGPIIISTKSIIPVVIDLITNAALAVASFASTIASVLVQFSIKFQSMGETLLAAFFVLSFLQAAVAMYQVKAKSGVFDVTAIFQLF